MEYIGALSPLGIHITILDLFGLIPSIKIVDELFKWSLNKFRTTELTSMISYAEGCKIEF